MSKVKFYLGMAAMILTVLFQACSAEDLTADSGQEIPDDNAKVYMNIDISAAVSAGTRSQTKPEGGSTDGTQEGTDVENKISNIMVLLVGHDADGKDNCFIAKWTADFASPLAINGDGETLTAGFSRSAFNTHYSEHNNADWAKNVSVYVICNYTTEIDGLVGTAGKGHSITWLDGILSVADYSDKNAVPYWKSNKFLMTNATRFPSTIPSKEEIESNAFDAPSRAYKLTGNSAIKVERAVARFDYAPIVTGSKAKKGDDDSYYYVIANAQNANEETGAVAQPEIHVRLTRMALVNMSKQFYLFRRVSADGTNKDWELGGLEHGDQYADGALSISANYVVDPEYAFKLSIAGKKTADFTQRFHYWFNDYKISDGADNGAIINEKWDGYNINTVNNSTTTDDYKVWRYIIPNTIPGQNTQKAAISTGIVFKGKIEAADAGIGIGKDMADHKDIFAYGSVILGSWQDVRRMAKKDEGDLKIAFNKAVKAVEDANKSKPDGEKIEPLDKDDDNVQATDWNVLTPGQAQAAVKGGGFSRYSYVENGGDGAGAGYFCYYYYWNRHNDNQKSGNMGTMEFGVVRNNVYKLGVTDIKRLGHPFRPGNDPDPVDPDDPDEDEKLYMVLSVKVLPWTVRKNNIELQ